MTFNSRLASVKREIEGRGDSVLKEETGLSVFSWSVLHHEVLFPALYRSLARSYQVPDAMREAFEDASFVSAIYEWCQFDIRDRHFDGPTYKKAMIQNRLFCPGGHGTGSVGPFQGYGVKAFEAIASSGGVRKFLRESKDFAGAKEVRSWMPRSNVDSPRPDPCNPNVEQMILQRGISRYELMKTPIISFIAKLALTFDFVRDIVQHVGRRLSVEGFPHCFPRRVMAWIILRTESTGDSRSEYRDFVCDRYAIARLGDLVSLSNGKTYESYLNRILPVMRLIGYDLRTEFVKTEVKESSPSLVP